MFGSAEADSFSAERNGNFSLIRLICIGTDVELAVFIGPFHKLFVNRPCRSIFGFKRFIDQDFNDFRVFSGYFTGNDFTGTAVDGDVIAFTEHRVVTVNPYFC